MVALYIVHKQGSTLRMRATFTFLHLLPQAEIDAEEARHRERLDDDERSDADEPMQVHESTSDQEDLMEILADTEDEGVPPQHRRVKSFMHRPSWQRLERHGLTHIPTAVPGVYIGCHATTRCWQSFFPGVHSGLSFSWSGSTNRTEVEALLKCLKALLSAYTQKFPREKLWNLGIGNVYIYTPMCACIYI